MSTHNICFRGKIRKISSGYPVLAGVIFKGVVKWQHNNDKNRQYHI